MNSTQRKRTEAKVRALAFAQVEGEIMPLSDMKGLVLQACKDRMNSRSKDMRRENRKARLRLARRVAFATACLLIGVCVFAVLDPVPVSNANGFFKRAQIWIGNVLQLDIAVEAPPKNPNQVLDAPELSGGYTALKEVHETYGIPVYEPTILPGEMKLGDVNVNEVNDVLVEARYVYQDQNNFVQFSLSQSPGEMGTNIYPEESKVYAAPAGTFYIWGTDAGWNALYYVQGYIVRIRGSLEEKAFLSVIDGLRAVN